MSNKLSCLLLAALLVTSVHAQPAWPTEGWQRSTPEEQGLDSRALEALVAFGEAQQMDSLLVTRNGRIVVEAYYAPFRPGVRHSINSATKAVLGGLVGIAVEKGVLPPVDTPMLKLLPGRAAGPDVERKQAITLQHLLDQTSGLDWTEPLTGGDPVTMLQMVRTPDWAQFVLQRAVVQPPGAGFNYSSGNSQLVSEIFSTHTGGSAEAFAARHLFAPLGIREWQWRSDPKGRSIGGWGLRLLPRDMAKLGLLYLQRGQWEGRQVIPQAWVDKVFAASVPMQLGGGSDFRHADGWWTIPGRQAYMAVGFHRQLIVVLPRSGIVAALTGRFHYAFEPLLDRIEAAVQSDAAMPANAAALASLEARVAAMALEKPDPVRPPSALAESLSGRTWAAERNAGGVREFTLRFVGQPTLEVVSARFPGSSELRTVAYPLGMQGRFEPGGTAAEPVLSKAGWIDERTLAIQQRFLQDGETADLRLRFEGDTLEVDYSHSAGGRAKFSARSKP